jgi:hypothetical protein
VKIKIYYIYICMCVSHIYNCHLFYISFYFEENLCVGYECVMVKQPKFTCLEQYVFKFIYSSSYNQMKMKIQHTGTCWIQKTRKIIVMSAYIKKSVRCQINDLMIHMKLSEKQGQANLKISRWRD